MPRLLSPKGKSVLRKLFPFKKIRPPTTPHTLTRTTGTTPIPVTRDTRTYLEKQGWTLDTSSYPATWHGYYRTRHGSFKGRIEASNPSRFYFQHPPKGLSRHSHRACFHALDNGWYSIHFSTMPRDLDSGVLLLERILHESYVLTQKSA